jgi:hypothetical protein
MPRLWAGRLRNLSLTSGTGQTPLPKPLDRCWSSPSFPVELRRLFPHVVARVGEGNSSLLIPRLRIVEPYFRFAICLHGVFLLLLFLLRLLFTVGPVGFLTVVTAAYRLIVPPSFGSQLSPPGALRAQMARETCGRERENYGREMAE